MRTAAGDLNPRRAPLPSSLIPSPALTEDGEKGKRKVGGGGLCIWEGTALGEGRTQGHSFPLQEDGFQEGPVHLFALACLYVLFHLKVPTTHLETEMDSKTDQGRESRAICQNGATMLTAAVCVNISAGSQVKMTSLKYDTWEIMEKRGYISLY